MTRTHRGLTKAQRQRLSRRDRTQQLSRRRLLKGLSGTTAALVLAGCLGDDEQTDDEESDDRGTSETDEEQTENDETEKPDVPEEFDDPEQLRALSREYIELLEDGEYDTAAEWVDPEMAGFLNESVLETAWVDTIGEDATLDSLQTVAYLGTELGAHSFVIWATLDGEDYEFSIRYSDDGVILFDFISLADWSAPEYADESAITETELELETPLDCDLGGTLTVPETDDPVPGVVLVHGNGPQDRDAAAGPNRPFKELAWGLANQGIAVLRYDKRTFACEPDIANATIDDIVTDDALTAISRLREHEQVNDEHVWVAGFSFGGLLAPRIAQEDGNLEGTVMLAPGPARSFAETIRDQVEHNLDVQGVAGPERTETLELVDEEMEQVETLDIDDDEVIRFGGREYYESLQAYDHEETAAALDIPQLLLQGGRDWQVTVEDDLPVWEDAIGDKDTVEITVYDDLNHLFQVSEGEMTQAEYVEPDSPVDEQVIEDITSFIEEHTAQPLEKQAAISQ